MLLIVRAPDCSCSWLARIGAHLQPRYSRVARSKAGAESNLYSVEGITLSCECYGDQRPQENGIHALYSE